VARLTQTGSSEYYQAFHESAFDQVAADLGLLAMSADEKNEIRSKLGFINGHGLNELAVSKKLNPKNRLQIEDIAPLAIVPNILVVNPSVPVNSIKELIDYAKANPGKLNFSSAGTGGAAHIAMAAFNVASGTTMIHVPYRGTPQSVGDVISGQVQATFTSGVSLLPHVRAGTLRALGVSTRERLSIAREIPAIAETLPGFDLSAWYGIVGPAGLPEPVVQRLHEEIRKAMASPDIAKRLNTEGAVHWDVSPQAFRNYVVGETKRWKSVIEAAKIKIE
jgi:tripartite-type tricarboxylate transporter receptor subunit TctC